MKEEYKWICITLLLGTGISLLIIGLSVLNYNYDPIKKGVVECVQLYHDTRSDGLYDECFDVL